MNVKQFVATAVQEGIEQAPQVYMETLDDALRSDVIVTEAGSAENLLQAMINEVDFEEDEA